MPSLSLEFILFVLFLILIAIALDVALIRAWRRHKKMQKKDPAASSTPAPGRQFPFSLFRRSPATTKPEAGSIPPPPVKNLPVAAAVLQGASVKGKARAGRKFSASPPASEAPRASAKAGSAVAESPDNIGSGHARNSAGGGLPGKTTHVQVSVDLPEGETVRVTIESLGTGKAPQAVGTERWISGAAGRPAIAVSPAARLPGPAAGEFADTALNRLQAAARNAFSTFWESARTSGRSLFYLALVIYLLTRLTGLTRWPIYFFTDEAVQTNFAAELWKGGLTWHNGEVLPTFFENAGQYEMNFSVYSQIVPYLIFGKSVFVNRAVSVLVTLLGMAAVGLMLKKSFRLPQWWSGVLMLSIIPAWFIHSRTSFESAEAVAFYAVFLYFYFLYREENPKYLFPALFFGALCAYTYSPAQMVMLVCGVLLLLSDLRYHCQHRKTALLGLLFLGVLALPYIRFLIEHPSANKEQLAIVSSVWLRNIPVTEKLQLYVGEYLKGFDPRYWYLPNAPESIYHDIARHLMKGYGHIALWSLPFALAGLLLCLGNMRHSRFRVLLIALLAAPSGAALAQITVTRSLFIVVPVALLTSIGIGWLLILLEARGEETPEFLDVWRDRVRRFLALLSSYRRTRSIPAVGRGLRAFWSRWQAQTDQALQNFRGIARIPRFTLSLGLFAVLTFVNGYMLWDGLANGPTWYTDYQLYGMQYGGEQLSTALQEYLKVNPDTNFIITTSWANGTDELFRFFLPEDFRYRAGTVDEYMQSVLPIAEQDVFVTTLGEYQRAEASGRFAEIRVEETIPYPDGTPGFYFVRLRYIDNIQQIIDQEKAAQAQPVEETLDLRGEKIRVVHSRFDNGSIASGFDGDARSLMRTQTANPMMLEMYFPAPRRFTAVHILVGGGPTRLTVFVFPVGGGDPVEKSTEVPRASDFRDVAVTLDEPVESEQLRLEILTVGEGEPNHVHVYEMRLEAVGWESGPAIPVP
jgi:hypothetical protein